MKNKILVFFIVMFYALGSFAQSANLKEADSLFLLGDYSKAIEKYKISNSPRYYGKIADAYSALGNYDQALMYYSKAMEAMSHSMLIKYKYAKLLSKTGNHHQALSLFHELIALDNQNPNYFYELGLSLEHQKDTSAIYGFRKAFQLDNTHQKAVYKLARIHLVKKNYDSVKHYVDLGLQSYANNKKLISIQAQSYYLKKEYQKAILGYNRLLELSDPKLFIHENLRECYCQTNQPNKAIEHGVLALGFEPSDVSNLYALCLLYEQVGDDENAEKFLEKSILNMDIPLDEEYLKLGYIQQKQKKYKEALFNLKKAIKENSDNIDAHFYLVYTKDQFYKDSNVKIKLYENFKKSFPNSKFQDVVNNRLKQLNKETFFGNTVP